MNSLLTTARSALWTLLTGVLLLGIWYALKYGAGIDSFLLPAPHEVILAGWDQRNALAASALATAQKALLGFGLGSTVGFLLAAAMALRPALKSAFYPWILALQLMPIVVLVPILVTWFYPQNDRAVIAITALGTFFPVVANTYRGLTSVKRHYRELYQLYGASSWQTLTRLRIPFALPHLFTGLIVAAAMATIGALFGEIFAGTNGESSGLGMRTLVYYREARTPELYATGLSACVLGFLFVSVVIAVNQILGRYTRPEAR